MTLRCRLLVLLVVSLALAPIGAAAQSTHASVAGVVRDEHGLVLKGALIVVRDPENGRTGVDESDDTGRFRILGLPPGTYTITVALARFATETQTGVVLTVAEELNVPVVLRLANVKDSVDVTASPIETTKSTLGRTFGPGDIDALPAQGRNFVALAFLTPGIAADQAVGGQSAIAVAAQTSRNNQVLVDGLVADSMQTGRPRTRIPLDAIQEFAVLSHNLTAEFGQASGGVVSVVTRSGTNRPAGRVSYLHRPDALSARPGSAELAHLDKASVVQKTASGFVGGPLKRDRAFLFVALETTVVDSETIVTSADVLKLFRPNEPASRPNPVREPQGLGRVDLSLGSRHHLTVRYDGSRHTEGSYTTEPAEKVAKERTYNYVRDAGGLSIVDSYAIGPRALNETRFQLTGLAFELGLTTRCWGCPTEDHQNLLLGQPPNAPRWIGETRWQLGDVFTTFAPGRLGSHTLKAGVDVNVTENDEDLLGNRYGTFTFARDEPFDPSRIETQPRKFSKTTGESFSHLTTRLYSVFLQDQWQMGKPLTLNVGVRWDYIDAVGFSRRADNVAPRLGASLDPWGRGRTAIRGAVGRYYGTAYMQFTGSEVLAGRQSTLEITLPVYWPWAPGTPFIDPLETAQGLAVKNTLGSVTKDVPFTDQASVGIQHALISRVVVSIDAVYARGRRLLMRRDQNYPLNVGEETLVRRDLTLGSINAVESIGNSWYSALLVGVEKRMARHHAYSIAYTYSSSERDTEDHNFIPQDQRDPGAERAPSSSDARHRFVASVNLELPVGFQFSSILTARSALPYNVLAGKDRNKDGLDTTDRPAGFGRNSERGDDLWQVDARVSKHIQLGARVRLELLAEAFNVFNHRNWTDYDGKQTSAFFGRPRSSAIAREVQLGVRVSF